MERAACAKATAETENPKVAPPNVGGVALVLEGGGMRAAHTAGVIAALIEHEVWFPYV